MSSLDVLNTGGVLPIVPIAVPDRRRSVFSGRWAEFVKFCENNAEWDSVFAKPFHEFKVDFLWFMAAVYQHEQICHLLAV